MADNFISAVKAFSAKLRTQPTPTADSGAAPAQQQQQSPSTVVKVIRQNPNLLRSRTGNGR